MKRNAPPLKDYPRQSRNHLLRAKLCFKEANTSADGLFTGKSLELLLGRTAFGTVDRRSAFHDFTADQAYREISAFIIPFFRIFNGRFIKFGMLLVINLR